MNLEQTLEELGKLNGYWLDHSHKGWRCGWFNPYLGEAITDYHSTPLAAAQQCLERAKNVK